MMPSQLSLRKGFVVIPHACNARRVQQADVVRHHWQHVDTSGCVDLGLCFGPKCQLHHTLFTL
jgi:hypothetical protein